MFLNLTLKFDQVCPPPSQTISKHGPEFQPIYANSSSCFIIVTLFVYEVFPSEKATSNYYLMMHFIFFPQTYYIYVYMHV